MTARTVYREQRGVFTIEDYRGASGPQDAPRCPPGSLGLTWPTGFDGHGYVVRDAAGVIVFAHAWRRYCLEYVDGQAA